MLTAGVLGFIDTAGFTVGSGALSAAFVYLYNGRRRQEICFLRILSGSSPGFIFDSEVLAGDICGRLTA